MSEKRRNAWGVYDLPLWKDWLAYLTVFGALAGLPYGLLGIAFQVVLFGIVPGSVRIYVRRRGAGRPG